jgi:hypothetical protein
VGAAQEARLNKAAVNIRHPGRDILPELKLLVAFADLDRAQLTGPVVDVLKQVAMDRPEMSKVE